MDRNYVFAIAAVVIAAIVLWFLDKAQKRRIKLLESSKKRAHYSIIDHILDEMKKVHEEVSARLADDTWNLADFEKLKKTSAHITERLRVATPLALLSEMRAGGNYDQLIPLFKKAMDKEPWHCSLLQAGTSSEELDLIRSTWKRRRVDELLVELRKATPKWTSGDHMTNEQELREQLKILELGLEDVGTGEPELHELRRHYHASEAKLALSSAKSSSRYPHQRDWLAQQLVKVRAHLNDGALTPQHIGTTEDELGSLQNLCGTKQAVA